MVKRDVLAGGKGVVVTSDRSEAQAFIESSESITGNIVKTISKEGIKAVYEALEGEDKDVFEQAYSASYLPAKEILQEIYDEVASGNEIRTLTWAPEASDAWTAARDFSRRNKALESTAALALLSWRVCSVA